MKKSIESVLQQSYPSFNLIVVDDCSTDDSRKLINQYADSNKITKIFHESNKGHGGSFNSAFAHAISGSFLVGGWGWQAVGKIMLAVKNQFFK